MLLRTPQATKTTAEATPPETHGTGELELKLDSFKAELRAAGLRESTIHAYLLGALLFVRWLLGDYVPRARRCGQVRPG